MSRAASPGANVETQGLPETETMADLYLRQGHSAEAARIYEALLQRSVPGDSNGQRIAQKLRALEGAAPGGASPREAVLRDLLTRVVRARARGRR